MKITILALHLGFGGVEKYISTVANMLSEKHDVEILVTYKVNDEPAFSINSNVQIKYLSEGIIPNSKEFKNAKENFKIFDMLKEGIKAAYILHTKYRINKKAISECVSDVIISTRDYHNEMIQKYARTSIIKISSEHNHHNGNKDYINRVVNSCKGFDYFLPISKELVLFYKPLLPDVKVEYIPFCIDKPNVDVILTFEKPIYINVGRLSPEKGGDDLLTIFSLIVERQKEALLHIVGDGIMMEKMKDKVKSLGLSNNVIIHGFIQKDEIDKLYAKSSLFLMTSHTESFGFVLLEAMACGIPCIAFDSAQGAKEIIKNNVNGLLIENRDFDKFVDCTLNLYADKQKLKSMSENAKTCLQEYSYENTKEQWLTLMEQIAEHSSK